MAEPLKTLLLAAAQAGTTGQPSGGQGVALNGAGQLPANVAAQSIPHYTADPAVPTNGMVWTRSDLGTLRIRVAGVTKSLSTVGQELAYNQITTGITVSATTEGTANTIVTASAVTFDGTTVALIEFWSPAVTCLSAAAGQTVLVLLEDGAAIGQAYTTADAGGNTQLAGSLNRRLTPSAGSHTYAIKAFRNVANTFVSAGPGGAGNPVPAYIRITAVA